jgi:hypothetical protein
MVLAGAEHALMPRIGTCKQHKARNGVQLRAKSVQSVRAMFSQLSHWPVSIPSGLFFGF